MEDEINAKRNDLVRAGVSFMREAYKFYGVDKGTALWDAVMDEFDPDLKGDILMSMLVGKDSHTVVIRNSIMFNGNRVQAIKALRTFDSKRPGLKEAKDALDSLVPMVNGNYLQPLVRELRIVTLPGQTQQAIREFTGMGLEAY